MDRPTHSLPGAKVMAPNYRTNRAKLDISHGCSSASVIGPWLVEMYEKVILPKATRSEAIRCTWSLPPTLCCVHHGPWLSQ